MTTNSSATHIEKFFIATCKLPYCKINREEFLTKQLNGKVGNEKLADALENGTINAGIPIDILNKLADGTIKNETLRATSLSSLAGIPGGLGMLATVPGDLVQFYTHVMRVAQKLAYIYGHKEINLDDAEQSELMIFLAVMFGIDCTVNTLAKLIAANSTKISTRIVSKPLTKYAIYNISKKVLKWVGINLTKKSFGGFFGKLIPIVGGAVSGVITYLTFPTMAKRLSKELSKIVAMSPEELEKIAIEADIVSADFEPTEK
jgi:hypothetical protein